MALWFGVTNLRIGCGCQIVSIAGFGIALVVSHSLWLLGAEVFVVFNSFLVSKMCLLGWFPFIMS